MVDPLVPGADLGVERAVLGVDGVQDVDEGLQGEGGGGLGEGLVSGDRSGWGAREGDVLEGFYEKQLEGLEGVGCLVVVKPVGRYGGLVAAV